MCCGVTRYITLWTMGNSQRESCTARRMGTSRHGRLLGGGSSGGPTRVVLTIGGQTLLFSAGLSTSTGEFYVYYVHRRTSATNGLNISDLDDSRHPIRKLVLVRGFREYFEGASEVNALVSQASGELVNTRTGYLILRAMR